MLFALMASALAGDVATIDEKTGWGGLAWGDPVPAGWTQTANSPSLPGGACYTNGEPAGAAGTVTFTEARYCFLDNRFAKVQLFMTTSNYFAVKTALGDKYGPGETDSRWVELIGDYALWKGEVTQAWIQRNVHDSRLNLVSMLEYRSAAIDAEMNAALKAKQDAETKAIGGGL